MLWSAYFFLFLLLFNPIFPSLAFSHEFISGQVLVLNEKKMEIVIDSKVNQESRIKSEQRTLIRIGKNNVLPKHNGEPVFPGCVKSGNWIRIWGYREQDKQDVIFAYDIRGCADGGCSDPSGIMPRLKRQLGVSKKYPANKRSGKKGNSGESGKDSNRGGGHRGGNKGDRGRGKR